MVETPLRLERSSPREFQSFMIREELAPFALACPACRAPLGKRFAFDRCGACGREFSIGHSWDRPIVDLCVSESAERGQDGRAVYSNKNEATEAAYKIYSKYYAPVALLAYLIVWRGNFPRHVAFFRELLEGAPGGRVVDIATGDGSLTQLALFKSRKARAAKVLAVDISVDMLTKAARKLPRANSILVRGDALRLPLADRSVPALSCFGGFNSFPAGAEAMRELARVLAPEGRLRGSVLLMPREGWRSRLVRDWIGKGYQSEAVDLEKFQSWVKGAGLALSKSERHGDVLLFEARHAT
jgi:SAM-dependent methyltransferase